MNFNPIYFINAYYNWFNYLAIGIAIFYASLAYLAWQHTINHSSNSKLPNWQTVVLILTTVLHSLLLLVTILHPNGLHSIHYIRFGYAQVLSLASCIGIGLFIIESRFISIDSLRPLALTLPTVAVVLGQYLPTALKVSIDTISSLHMLFGIAAHAVALLASGHALLLLALHRILKQKYTVNNYWIIQLTRHCPALVVLERLLIRQSVWVFVLLSITVGLGIYNNVLYIDYKTVLCISSVWVWLSIAYGYKQKNFRGIILCMMVWFATGLLLLSYIGSRFIQTLL